MSRCLPLAAAVAAAALALPAGAQLQRSFPANALRGELVVVAPPEVQLNGQPARLAPGARIRNVDNLITLSASLVGSQLPVHYTLDGDGQLRDVWILQPHERARQPWPATLREAQTWAFDPVAQTWVKR